MFSWDSGGLSWGNGNVLRCVVCLEVFMAWFLWPLLWVLWVSFEWSKMSVRQFATWRNLKHNVEEMMLGVSMTNIQCAPSWRCRREAWGRVQVNALVASLKALVHTSQMAVEHSISCAEMLISGSRSKQRLFGIF